MIVRWLAAAACGGFGVRWQNDRFDSAAAATSSDSMVLYHCCGHDDAIRPATTRQSNCMMTLVLLPVVVVRTGEGGDAVELFKVHYFVKIWTSSQVSWHAWMTDMTSVEVTPAASTIAKS